MTKNYKLTGDLTKDCMALIPENVERLNESQNIFTINYWDCEIIEFNNLNLYDSDGEAYSIINFFRLIEPVKFTVLSHCLRTIPEFQEPVENIKIKIELKPKVNPKLCCPQSVAALPLVIQGLESGEVVLNLNSAQIPTIASVTLHGQGEYPPSTLDELCESYRNVLTT